MQVHATTDPQPSYACCGNGPSASGARDRLPTCSKDSRLRYGQRRMPKLWRQSFLNEVSPTPRVPAASSTGRQKSCEWAGEAAA
jgi:hypothetical protein